MGRSEKVKLAKPNGKREKGKEWWQLLASYSTIIGNQTSRKLARTNEMNRKKILVGLTPPISDIPDSHMAPSGDCEVAQSTTRSSATP